jgi:hypothetical protein
MNADLLLNITLLRLLPSTICYLRPATWYLLLCYMLCRLSAIKWGTLIAACWQAGSIRQHRPRPMRQLASSMRAELRSAAGRVLSATATLPAARRSKNVLHTCDNQHPMHRKGKKPAACWSHDTQRPRTHAHLPLQHLHTGQDNACSVHAHQQHTTTCMHHSIGDRSPDHRRGLKHRLFSQRS